MQLEDIKDVERYLAEDCYCTGEIYDVTGFFFQVFKPEEECTLLYHGVDFRDEEDTVDLVVCRDQLIAFWTKGGKVYSAERYDATENNVKVVEAVFKGELKGTAQLDEFKAGESEKALKGVMQVADAIMVD